MVPPHASHHTMRIVFGSLLRIGEDLICGLDGLKFGGGIFLRIAIRVILQSYHGNSSAELYEGASGVRLYQAS